jgi:hypothetical protein
MDPTKKKVTLEILCSLVELIKSFDLESIDSITVKDKSLTEMEEVVFPNLIELMNLTANFQAKVGKYKRLVGTSIGLKRIKASSNKSKKLTYKEQQLEISRLRDLLSADSVVNSSANT